MVEDLLDETKRVLRTPVENGQFHTITMIYTEGHYPFNLTNTKTKRNGIDSKLRIHVSHEN